VAFEQAASLTATFAAQGGTSAPDTPHAPELPQTPEPPAVPLPVPAPDGPAPLATAFVAAATAVTPARPRRSARPVIHGRARAGRALTCTRGTWLGAPSSYAFTWRRDGRVVGHGRTHVVRAADRGHTLRCDVKARGPGGAATAASRGVRVPRVA
jgi:hypothetical protein